MNKLFQTNFCSQNENINKMIFQKILLIEVLVTMAFKVHKTKNIWLYNFIQINFLLLQNKIVLVNFKFKKAFRFFSSRWRHEEHLRRRAGRPGPVASDVQPRPVAGQRRVRRHTSRSRRLERH